MNKTSTIFDYIQRCFLQLCLKVDDRRVDRDLAQAERILNRVERRIEMLAKQRKNRRGKR